MKDLLTELAGRSAHLKTLEETEEVKWRIRENDLSICRVQQILLDRLTAKDYSGMHFIQDKQDEHFEKHGVYASTNGKIGEWVEEYVQTRFVHCTRVEVIDKSGRAYVNMSCETVDPQLQDEKRTLKIFIS